MDRGLLPLLLASGLFVDSNETEPLDNLRMQKGIFLLVQAGNPEWRHLYSFIPYDWGPYSSELNQVLGQLSRDGLIAKEPFPNRSYTQYKTTPRGERVLGTIPNEVSVADGIFIRNVRRYVNTRPFAQLLREVYKAYPEYAINSRFASV